MAVAGFVEWLPLGHRQFVGRAVAPALFDENEWAVVREVVVPEEMLGRAEALADGSPDALADGQPLR